MVVVHPRIIRHYLHPMQGIAELFSARPNFGMSQKNHIGEKLRQEAEKRGLKPAQVAEIFGVRPPSVYDWYEHGRIHQRHYPTLVEWSGLSIEWWLDIAPSHRVEEPARPYADLDPRQKALLELFEGLPSADQDELFRTLEEKKQHYEAVISELTARKKRGKAA